MPSTSSADPSCCRQLELKPSDVQHQEQDLNLQSPAKRLQCWGVRKRLRQEQIESLVLLLDKKHLRKLRIRRKSRAWPKVPQANNFRHHFYRQAAHILGWIDQQAFEEDFVEIVRSTFPDENHATPPEILEEGKGGEIS